MSQQNDVATKNYAKNTCQSLLPMEREVFMLLDHLYSLTPYAFFCSLQFSEDIDGVALFTSPIQVAFIRPFAS